MRLRGGCPSVDKRALGQRGQVRIDNPLSDKGLRETDCADAGAFAARPSDTDWVVR